MLALALQGPLNHLRIGALSVSIHRTVGGSPLQQAAHNSSSDPRWLTTEAKVRARRWMLFDVLMWARSGRK
jgi:hypothetical protein